MQKQINAKFDDEQYCIPFEEAKTLVLNGVYTQLKQ
jgi:hypothetical protein